MPTLIQDLRFKKITIFEMVHHQCLSTIKPVHRARPISSQEVTHVLRSIKVRKAEVAELNTRVHKLEVDVAHISGKLETMRRPVSVMQDHKYQIEGSDLSSRPMTSMANVDKRVKWDISPHDIVPGKSPMPLTGDGDLVLDNNQDN